MELFWTNDDGDVTEDFVFTGTFDDYNWLL